MLVLVLVSVLVLVLYSIGVGGVGGVGSVGVGVSVGGGTDTPPTEELPDMWRRATIGAALSSTHFLNSQTTQCIWTRGVPDTTLDGNTRIVQTSILHEAVLIQ